MRKFTATIGGEEVTLAATFEAGEEVHDKVMDPFQIAHEAHMEHLFSQQGIRYEPKFKLTVKNIPLILHAGMKAAGDNRSIQEVKELCFTAGYAACLDAVQLLLARLVSPAPEKTPVTASKSAKTSAGAEGGESGKGGGPSS